MYLSLVRVPVLAVLICQLFGCASSINEPGTPSWVLFENPSVTPLTKGQARIILYRLPEKQADSQSINIYINGDYHTSLRQNGQSVAEVCPGRNEVSAAINDANLGYAVKHGLAHQALQLDKGQQIFVRIQRDETGGAQNLATIYVNPSDAQRDLGGIARQSHTLSRLQTPTCPN